MYRPDCPSKRRVVPHQSEENEEGKVERLVARSPKQRCGVCGTYISRQTRTLDLPDICGAKCFKNFMHGLAKLDKIFVIDDLIRLVFIYLDRSKHTQLRSPLSNTVIECAPRRPMPARKEKLTPLSPPRVSPSRAESCDDPRSCPLCMDREVTHLHQTIGCGRAFCSACLGSLPKPVCPFCQQSLAGSEVVVPLPDKWVSRELMRGFSTQCSLCCSGMSKLHTHPGDPLMACGISAEEEGEGELGIFPFSAYDSSFWADAAEFRKKHAAIDALHARNNAPCCTGETKIIIKDLSGFKSSRQCDLQKAKASTLRECLAERHGTCAAQVRLIVRGHPLVDDYSLERNGVKAGDTVHMIIQMRGS